MLETQDITNLSSILSYFEKTDKIIELIKGDLFTLQRDLIEDSSTRKTLCCGRRSGKTYTLIRYMLATALKQPGANVFYITDTRNHAEELVWQPLKSLVKNVGLEGTVTFNDTKLRARLLNGSTMYLFGADKRDTAERLRGFYYNLVLLDEAGSFRSTLEYLLADVISPALRDYHGTLVLCGTPNASCAGSFYDSCHNDKWSHHHWNVLSNPQFPAWANTPNWEEVAAQMVDEWRIEEGYDSADDASYRREYLGEWVRSADTMMYHLEPSRNVEQFIPQADTKYTLGLDLGWHDETALVVLGYSATTNRVYLVDSIHQPNVTLETIRSLVESMIIRYRPAMIAMDSAGAGKIILETLADEIHRRYQIPVTAAEKTRKAAFVRLLDGDIIRGLVKFPSADNDVYRQLQSLHWNDTFTLEDPTQKCDLADAFLYAWRACYHWIERRTQLPEHQLLSVEQRWVKQRKEMQSDDFYDD